MADGVAASAELSSSQQDTLGQYVALTNQEPKDALPLLERSQWNLQVSAPSDVRHQQVDSQIDRDSQVLRW